MRRLCPRSTESARARKNCPIAPANCSAGAEQSISAAPAGPIRHAGSVLVRQAHGPDRPQHRHMTTHCDVVWRPRHNTGISKPCHNGRRPGRNAPSGTEAVHRRGSAKGLHRGHGDGRRAWRGTRGRAAGRGRADRCGRTDRPAAWTATRRQQGDRQSQPRTDEASRHGCLLSPQGSGSRNDRGARARSPALNHRGAGMSHGRDGSSNLQGREQPVEEGLFLPCSGESAALGRDSLSTVWPPTPPINGFRTVVTARHRPDDRLYRLRRLEEGGRPRQPSRTGQPPCLKWPVSCVR